MHAVAECCNGEETVAAGGHGFPHRDRWLHGSNSHPANNPVPLVPQLSSLSRSFGANSSAICAVTRESKRRSYPSSGLILIALRNFRSLSDSRITAGSRPGMSAFACLNSACGGVIRLTCVYAERSRQIRT
jgi:hypothetical protein